MTQDQSTQNQALQADIISTIEKLAQIRQNLDLSIFDWLKLSNDYTQDQIKDLLAIRDIMIQAELELDNFQVSLNK